MLTPRNSRAIWISQNLIAVPEDFAGAATDGNGFELVGNPDLKLLLEPLGSAAKVADPRTAHGYRGLRIYERAVGDQPHPNPAGLERVRRALRGPLLLRKFRGQEEEKTTGVQIGPVLDALFGAAAQVTLGTQWLGGVPTLRLWAPTARSVELQLYASAQPSSYPASFDEVTGVWELTGNASWRNAKYLWEVELYDYEAETWEPLLVTDPYSTGLTVDSKRSVLTDLADEEWKPNGWGTVAPPPLRTQAAQTIYELHVRDFSIFDASVPRELRGTYAAFGVENSRGRMHLEQLANAGITSLHLLPTYDIASSSIPEARDEQKTPQIDGIELLPENESKLTALDGYGPASTVQQAAVGAVKNVDGFNWGYDPLHWGAPEGSYATEGMQDGGARTLQFREMVQTLHGLGLRVVQDVVYNHTMEHGCHNQSVLDRIVPGYYHRLDADGKVETSTCCSNIATERIMAEKLMVETLVTWARHYRIDGFRFDLMGHHSLENMLKVRKALDALTPQTDGVDGSSIYLYGEGWNFGEVANDALFTQARQGNLGGTGIGAFNDRLRDGVRGGSPTDPDHRLHQGFASGLYTDPNSVATEQIGRDSQRRTLEEATNFIILGLAGSLEDFPVPTPHGPVLGKDLDYAGQRAGFASQPEESVNYVEAHDNESLFDSNVFKLPQDATMEARIRLQTVANATVALAQSPAFFAAGTEILRSKSLDRDSYNSGDWFNGIDWSLRRHTFGTGLPAADRNEAAWGIMVPYLEDQNIVPGESHMLAAREMFLDLLRLRSSSPLFTLGRAELVKSKLRFPSAGTGGDPGVIVMALDDQEDPVDPTYSSIVVVFNGTPDTWTDTVAGFAGRHLELHPVQAGGFDEVVKRSSWDSVPGAASVPGRTVTVFVERRK